MVLGLILVSIGAYPVLFNLTCILDPRSCVGWAFFAARLFLIPGIFIFLAGTVSYLWKGWSFAAIQTVLVGMLAAYFVWAFAPPH